VHVKLRMKLGIVSDEISRDFAAAVRTGVALGLRRYEIRNLIEGRAPMCGEAAMREVEQIAREADVEITALSPGLFKNTGDAAAFRREMAEVYPRAAEWAQRWKLPGLIVFGFHKPGATEATAPEFSSAHPPDEVVEWLSEAGERARADGLTLMVEPEPICWCDSGAATAALIARASTAGLKINYDPGNVAWLQNRDPLDEFPAVAPYIANVHIKDLRPLTRGAGFPEWVPAGEGMIDYLAHFRRLREIGYRGPVSLEPHMDGSAEATRRCLEAVERAADHDA
jgi:L-ribulose-5-phosphate 3-epimerase